MKTRIQTVQTKLARALVLIFISSCGLACQDQPVAHQPAPRQERVIKLPPPDATLTSRLHSEVFHSRLLNNDRNLEVYLPPGYSEDPGRRYPVMYTNGWSGLFVFGDDVVPDRSRVSVTHETPESLAVTGAIQPVIVVTVNSPLGQPDVGRPTNTRNFGEAVADEANEQSCPAYLYGRMLVEEIKPYIDSKYRTLSDQSNTAIAGISIGAQESLYVALCHPDTFGKLALISPAVRHPDYLTVRRLLLLHKPLPWKVWMDAGSLETDFLKDTAMLEQVFLCRGWDPANVKRFVGEGDAHNGKGWEKRVGPIFRYLFPNDESAPAVRSSVGN